MNTYLNLIRVRVLTNMLMSDLRDGYVIGQRIRARELSEITGVRATEILQMASEVAIIQRMGSV